MSEALTPDDTRREECFSVRTCEVRLLFWCAHLVDRSHCPIHHRNLDEASPYTCYDLTPEDRLWGYLHVMSELQKRQQIP